MPAVTIDTLQPNGSSSNGDAHHKHAHRRIQETASCCRTVNLPTTYPSQALRFLRKVCTEDSAVGAGIQIPPNSGRLLQRWNVFEHLQRYAVQPEGINFRRWETGNVIGRTAFGQNFQDDFGVPYYVVHRAHFHEALYQRAMELGVSVELGCKVREYEESKGSLVLESGVKISGDLIVAADGRSTLPWAVVCLTVGNLLILLEQESTRRHGKR
ncbi:hypothetical protein N0V94_008303 [Neodidymelliopsis sp. IMI 364377]|nr:hypothetical protein N0V94_008303 [Neodidymelliopsis sp. IMI 364377]